jgi:phospholipase/lecithinase/hemolysin
MSNKQFFLLTLSFFLLTVLCIAYVRPQIFDKYIVHFFPMSPSRALVIKGIGVIGDSLSDEYQAEDARGYEYAPTTLNWIEQLVKNRKLNFGVWNQWGDSRRTGFQYNWSKSGATTADVIKDNQDKGLTQYIKDEEVNIVVIYIGGNDFSPFNTQDGYIPIYNGTLSGEVLQKKIETVVSNIKHITDTIQQTTLENGKKSEVKILLVTIPDWNLSPTIQLANRNDDGRQRVSGAIAAVNEELALFARKRKITLIDINEYYRKQLSHAFLGTIRVGTANISLYIPGDDPTRGFLSDTVHPGTILNGLFANYLLNVMNKAFGTAISPLSTDELLRNAGLKV